MGTELGSSQFIPGSELCLAVPSVEFTPCSEGYCPVKRVARLGVQAVDPA